MINDMEDYGPDLLSGSDPDKYVMEEWLEEHAACSDGIGWAMQKCHSLPNMWYLLCCSKERQKSEWLVWVWEQLLSEQREESYAIIDGGGLPEDDTVHRQCVEFALHVLHHRMFQRTLKGSKVYEDVIRCLQHYLDCGEILEDHMDLRDRIDLNEVDRPAAIQHGRWCSVKKDVCAMLLEALDALPTTWAFLPTLLLSYAVCVQGEVGCRNETRMPKYVRQYMSAHVPNPFNEGALI